MTVVTEARVVQLEGIIQNALKAMDEGLYGDARRILRGASNAPVKAVSSVLEKTRI